MPANRTTSTQEQPLTVAHRDIAQAVNSRVHQRALNMLQFYYTGLCYNLLHRIFIIRNVFVINMSHIDSTKQIQRSKNKGNYLTLTAYILAPHNLEFKQRKEGNDY